MKMNNLPPYQYNKKKDNKIGVDRWTVSLDDSYFLTINILSKL